VEFDGQLKAGDYTLGSAYRLLEALEELHEELDLEGESPDIADDEMELEVYEQQLGYAWRVFARGANASVKIGVPLHVIY
jgi:hypothetical protein